MEGRLGIYAKNLATGDEIAINADKLFPAKSNAGESRPAAPASPRQCEDCEAALRSSLSLIPNSDDRIRRSLQWMTERAMLAGGLSPTIEVAGEVLHRSGGIAGWASSPAGDMAFGILAPELGSEFTGARLFPEIVEACFRRLVPGFAEKPLDPKPPGLLAATLHERDQDPKLFPKPPEASAADARAGSRRVKFRTGEVARLAVLARPAAATIVTVQWWSPAERPESCTSQVLEPKLVGDAVFDQPVDKLGLWRVRVAFGDGIVLDEQFYVTGK